ncbi:MAG: Rieske (2Fe-2S) protein [Candidatus Poribacteria bacterium]|nr:Rieske (2Fe-2S) protein [Candidatus Poribacteria bacterium]
MAEHLAHSLHADDSKTEFIECAKVAEIPDDGIIAVNVSGQSIALAKSDGKIFAVDNRCPHMGYPLNRGSVHDGILICHWHHAMFDLASGCTFHPFADDVEPYPIEVRDGRVYVAVSANGANAVERWKERLGEGLEQSINLILAKSVIALRSLGTAPDAIVEVGALYGARGRRAGWGPAMTILTCMANVAGKLSDADKVLALYQGLLHVSDETSASAPRIALSELETDTHSLPQLKTWFRYFIEVRNADGAERTILTAIANGATETQVCDMMVAAATDHFYRDGGHTLDFINKAFELLERIGWEKADEVIPTLVGMLASSSRAEEQNRWRSPIDFVPVLRETFDELEALVAEGKDQTWTGSDALVEMLLADDPLETIDTLKSAIQDGATLTELTQTLTYAAALRIAQFHTKNEFGDWIAVLHTYTYCNALHQCAKRAPSVEIIRGIFHGAIAIYFDRWFNMPAARLPQHRRDTETLPTDADALLEEFVMLLDTQAQADKAGMYIYRYLSLGHPREPLLEKLGHILLREDAEFHSFQMLEAAFQQADELDEARAQLTLVAASRYLAAHAPTARARRQTANLALRLHRGEDLSADNPDEAVD